MTIKIATVFSGIGAIEQALKKEKIKHEIVFACDNGERKLKINENEIKEVIEHMTEQESNEYIQKLYDENCGPNNVEKSYLSNYHLQKEKFFQDARFLNGTNYKEKIDLFVGGSPCQSFSIAGKRKGLDEARGTLFYDYARLVNEIKPKVFIYENVPGMLNHDGGKTWSIISEIFDDLDYHWTYWILNAKDYGLPQNRRRIFAIGFRDDFKEHFEKLNMPQPIPLMEDMTAYLELYIDNKYYLPEKGFLRVINPKHKKHVALNGKVARCQVATQQYNWYGDMRFESEIPQRILDDERIYKGYYNDVFGVARCLTPRECLRLMGFTDDFKIVVPDQHMYRQVGNSIAVNVLTAIMKQILDTGIFDNDEK